MRKNLMNAALLSLAAMPSTGLGDADFDGDTDDTSEADDLGRYGGMGSVNFFGLDEFGQPSGLNPVWGALIGTGVANITPAAIRMASDDPDVIRWDEVAGVGAGVVASGAMLAFRGTRAAGWASLFGTLASAGVRALEKALMSDEKALIVAASYMSKKPAASQTQNGTEITQIPTLNGPVVNQTPALLGNAPTLPPQLLGAAANGLNGNVGAQQVPAGVQLNGLGRSFGSVVAGGNRG